MKSDGQIIIDSRINTDGVKAGTADIIASARRMAKSTQGLSNSVRNSMNRQVDSLQKASRMYEEQEAKVESLRQKLDELKGQQIPTQEYSSLESEIQKSEAALDRLIEKQIRFVDTGGNRKSRAFETMEYDIDQVRQKLESLRTQKESMEQGGTAFVSGEKTKATADAAKKLAEEEQKLLDIKNRLSTSASYLNGKLNESREKLEGTKKAADKSNNSFSKSIMTFLKYSLGIRSLYILVNKLRAALVGGFKNLAQYSSGTNKTLSGLMSSLTQCKNALATAFDPILQAIAPALNYLINLVTAAATAISQLISIITGKGTFVRAAKVQQDYAKSLKSTGSAAKKAGEDAKGALASFDKLNVQADNSSSDGGEGGGAGGGISPAEMFETVSINNNISKAIDAIKKKLSDLKQLFQQGFWDGLGDTSVFDSIKNEISSIGNSLIGIFNDSAVYGAINTFVDLFSYNLGRITGAAASIGLTIVDLLIGGIAQYLEENQGRIKEQLISLFDISSEISSLIGDWYTTIADIFTVFRGDTAKGIVADLIAIITDIVVGVTELLGKFTRDVLDAFLEPIRRNKEGIKQILNDVLQSVMGFTSAISELVRYIFDGLNKFYDDHQAEIKLFLETIAQSIYNTITNIISFAQVLIDSLTEVVKAIQGVLEGLIEFVSGVFSGDWERAWNGLKTIVKSTANGIIGIIEGMVNGVVRGLNRISFDIPDWSPIGAGSHFGFDIQPVRLPRLASGTVVPPRAGEFAAILGDNKRETEVVSPMSTIEKALENVLGRMNIGPESIELNINMDGRVVYQTVVERNQMAKKRTGKNPLLV